VTVPRLIATQSTLLVVDVQEKLLVAMPDAPGLVRDIGFLLDVAALVGVPSVATEQYPKGLGPTHPDLVRRLPADRPAKVAFSCCGVPGLTDGLKSSGRPSVVVVGMEAHVCVLNTVLDLLEAGSSVFVCADAVQSRYRVDQDTAVRRMDRAGAVLTTVETTAFEWMVGADHPQFKLVSKLVQERMRQMVGNGSRPTV
jgi:nicotinamidase-related amidase